ncbi:peptide ABC transporter substrate-binding protein [Bacillus pseudomycoides]|uniref:peptide ABC transporter substrate-binding protein n=1 Tax=Bacillus pseudomycoides TaxID=64104 RepID=UPI000BF22284|nr:peptide ABC transporter substrate-binding protein [Bacillus pseudomycoides]PEK32348.1 peptide ABC transporter substrate-binding protein [Bacillus pseudomycoides]PEK67960.1 peptide ABC transporter substrate-binding protein [Bacillus pseudomycoides]PEP38644.1 peptide ABC transporter substrate-binding protein [Bacillus pseudomycoides]PEP42140.1 peptide ABC transporter substrate-binding protein [Bacillus pseudomycoides]PFX51712.1 peptide ABC transporter substrate-binding protein [Bacillus pseud
MKQKKSRLLVITLVTSLILSACSSTANKVNKEVQKQVLNVTVSEEIPSLDTAKVMDGTSSHVMQNIFEGLYVLDNQDKPVPGVAKSFEKSEDGKRYTFHLRKDAKWSNGESVTAHDFTFSWKRTLSPETASQYAYMLFYIKNAQEINKGTLATDRLGVKALDNYTLEVQLEQPVPYLLQLLALPIYLPQHESFVKEQGDRYGLEPDNLIYNGAFVLEKWKHEQEFQLKKNDTYWDKRKVKLDEINFHIIKDTMTAVNLYESGSLDRVPINSTVVDQYKNNKELHVSSDPAIAMLRFNEGNTSLANKKLRQSISLAVNKEELINHFINNGASPAHGLIPTGYKNEVTGKDFRKENGNIADYDLEKAKELWEDAKKELGTENVTVEFLTFEQDNAKRIAEYIKGDLEKHLQGLTVQIKQQPFKQKLQLEQTGQYDISMVVWGPDYKDPINYLELFTTDSPNNKMDYSNSDYDDLIKKAKYDIVLDQQKRWKALQEAERIVLEDAAVAPLYHTGSAYIQKERIKGIEKHQFGGVYTYKHAFIAEK